MTAPTPQALADLLPLECVRDGQAARSWGSGEVGVVAFPRSTEETAAVLGRASEEGWRVAPAGRGSWTGFAGRARSPDLVVSVARVRAILEYEPADLTLTCEGGLMGSDVEARTRAEGQWLALDPPGWKEGALGATLSLGVCGTLQAGYGAARDQVLGLTAVTGDGRVLEVGGRVVKNVAGFDLVKLLVGSSGTLGIITSATVRLYPIPERNAVLRFTTPDEGELIGVARALAMAPVPVVALEWLEPSRGGDRGGDSPAAVLARISGGAEAVDETGEVLRRAAGGAGCDWLEGDSAGRAFEVGAREEVEADVVVRMSLLPSRLPELLSLSRELVALLREDSARSGQQLHIARNVHLTTGLLRLSVSGFTGSEAWHRHLGELRERLEAEGGSLRLSQAPLKLSDALGLRRLAPDLDRIVRGLRAEFDPAGILPDGGPAL